MFRSRFLAEPARKGRNPEKIDLRIAENSPPPAGRTPDNPVSSRSFAPIFSLFSLASRPIRNVFTFPSDLRRRKTTGRIGKIGRPSEGIFPSCPSVRALRDLRVRSFLRKIDRVCLVKYIADIHCFICVFSPVKLCVVTKTFKKSREKFAESLKVPTFAPAERK